MTGAIVRVRPYRHGDAPALAALFHAAVRRIAQYSWRTQVIAWSPAVPDPERFRMRGTNVRLLLIAVDSADAPLVYAIDDLRMEKALS